MYDLMTENFQEIKLDKAINNFLERVGYENCEFENLKLKYSSELSFIKISHITYARDKSQTDINLIDFEQILNAISSKTGKFIYVIESSKNGVNLYLGTHKDSVNFLNATFNGIYSGSSSEICQDLNFGDMENKKAMLGIPSLKRDSDKKYKQSLENILFPMQGKKFRIVIVADSYDNSTIKEIISKYQELGNEVHKLSKISKNATQSDSQTKGITFTTGISQSYGSSKTKGFSETDGYSNTTLWGNISQSFPLIGAAIGGLIAAPFGLPLAGAAIIGGFVGNAFRSSKTINHSITNSSSDTTSYTKTTNNSQSDSTSDTKTKGVGLTFEEINKNAQNIEKMIDKYIERFEKGLSYGMWNTSLYIQADDEITLSELEHTLKSVYSGDETHYESIRFTPNLKHSIVSLDRFPTAYFGDKIIANPIHQSFAGLNSTINSQELAILSALPNNDINGISVTKISDFGLTQQNNTKTNSFIEIGEILNKKKPINQRFKLSLDALNSHLFISGATGSGKSNTIKVILKKLNEKNIPFLVIEPAKSEYKNLLSDIKDLQIFRPGGKDDVFKFNPFIFEYNKNNIAISLTKHIDMLKTTFISAFAMYGPMPYVLEDAIYQVYEERGWNLNTESHPYFTNSDSFDEFRKSLFFPNMDDLKRKVVEVADKAGYYQDVGSNIKAALKTRINNLTLGIKGKIFNSIYAFDSKILFEKPTIIELSNIVNDEEKSFFMGLLLNKLYQYREESGNYSGLKHVTVIEEAHRLLPNISLNVSGEDSNARVGAVETFTNILAEIRSFGEGIIVADQIVSKLNQDVIKNTDIKIIHKTMSYEDRNLVGKAINLNDDQILDIAELKKGEAIVFNRDIHQPFLVKIDENKEILLQKTDMENFYEQFITKNPNFKYEMFYEKYYYLEEKPNLKELNLDYLKPEFIKFINLIFANNNILDGFKHLKSILPEYKDGKSYIYAVLYLFSNLNYISNYQYYNDIDCYMEVCRTFFGVLNSIINEKDDLKDRASKFADSFSHCNIKTIYPLMNSFPKYEIDYTLLILENISSSKNIFDIWSNIKIDDALNENLDTFLSNKIGFLNSNIKFASEAIKYIN